MKKMIPLLLAALLLAGCAASPVARPGASWPGVSVLPSKPSFTSPRPTVPESPVRPSGCRHTPDQYKNVDLTVFYTEYTPACCWEDAQLRSAAGLLSGLRDVPEQMFTRADEQPMVNGMYVRNSGCRYEDDGNTYVIVDGEGDEMMRIYKGGAYITLEEVAAYMYAFGGSAQSMPANYTADRDPSPSASIWGKYLRANHSAFSEQAGQYPCESELPDNSSCGGRLQYFEMDIGTTGTETSGAYNDGNRIDRGAARLVYARQDLNGNGVYEQGEVYVFYTYNQYNELTEYLNYLGGWGQTFGDSTPYPEVVYRDLFLENAA